MHDFHARVDSLSYTILKDIRLSLVADFERTLAVGGHLLRVSDPSGLRAAPEVGVDGIKVSPIVRGIAREFKVLGILHDFGKLVLEAFVKWHRDHLELRGEARVVPGVDRKGIASRRHALHGTAEGDAGFGDLLVAFKGCRGDLHERMDRREEERVGSLLGEGRVKGNGLRLLVAAQIGLPARCHFGDGQVRGLEIVEQQVLRRTAETERFLGSRAEEVGTRTDAMVEVEGNESLQTVGGEPGTLRLVDGGGVLEVRKVKSEEGLLLALQGEFGLATPFRVVGELFELHAALLVREALVQHNRANILLDTA